MSARSIAQYARKHTVVLSEVEQATHREKVEAVLRDFEAKAPIECKAIRHAAHRYIATQSGLNAKAELYRAAMALAKAMRK